MTALTSSRSRRRPPGERGIALPLALVVLLILAGLAVALAQMVEAELDVGRLTRWDAQALYLAQAGVEHEIYALKFNKNAGTLAPVNYPVTAGQESWYSVAPTDFTGDGVPDFCLLQCGVDREHRRWVFVVTGEIRQAGSGPPVAGPCTLPCLQRRSVLAVVEITYDWGSGANGLTGFYLPRSVRFLRWEEVYP